MRYLIHRAIAINSPVPQTEPLNERQTKNSAGGFSFALDKWARLARFLILGSEGGSYYATEQKLTEENANALAACVKEDGVKAVEQIVEISESGRAPKNDPALFALAYASSKGDDATRVAALDALPKVARIGTHLFNFAEYVTNLRGWGRGLRSAIGRWYNDQDADRLANQVTKYQSRTTGEGDASTKWTHRDLLRLSHVKPADRPHQAIAKWVVKGGELNTTAPDLLVGHTELQGATTAKKAAKLIRKYGLVRESVPTELLKDPEVWEALLEDMPVTAMIRNLGNLSKCGLLAPLSDASKLVISKLDCATLRKGRVHPIQLLIAQKTYGSGHGNKGKGVWTPVPQVVDALDDAFYSAFQNIEPSGKRFYLGLDVSGSMSGGPVAGINDLTPRAASSAMAMVTARSEENYHVAAFQDRMVPLMITPKSRLDDICRKTDRLPFGDTDCALPMQDALAKKMKVDVFAVYTDSETGTGLGGSNVHPAAALERYRQATGIPAKLVVVGMTSNGFSIADPNDKGMLDVVGFDSATPQIISQFAAA
jgi:60 kDa SS-A/Ro ribonucleoprotein